MLTAMKQEVARKHQKDAVKWALDDIVYHTEVTHYDKIDSVKSAPAEGCYIHGLFLEGIYLIYACLYDEFQVLLHVISRYMNICV